MIRGECCPFAKTGFQFISFGLSGWKGDISRSIWLHNAGLGELYPKHTAAYIRHLS